MNFTLGGGTEAVPLLVIALVLLITSLLTVRKARRSTVGPFRGTFDASWLGLAIIQPDGRWLRVNPQFSAIVGRVEAELIALDMASLVHPDDRERFGVLIAGRAGAAAEVIRLVHRRGQIFRARVGVSPMLDRGGNVSSLVMQVEDLSSREHAEKLLRDAAGSLRITNELLLGHIEGTDDPCAALDLDFRFVASTPAYRSFFLQAFGRDLELGLSLIQVLDDTPDERRYEVEPWERTLLGEGSTIVEEPGGEGEGPSKLWEFAFRSIRTAGGRRIGSSHLIRDVTDQGPASEAADRGHERLRAVFAHPPVAMAVLDQKLRHVAWSRRWAAEHGLEGRDLRGVSLDKAFPSLPVRWQEALGDGLAGATRSFPEDTLIRPDGQVVHLRWAVAPWGDPERPIGGVILVTERVDDLVLAREAARSGSRLKSDLLASLGSEVRTSLSGIIGLSELPMGDQPDGPWRDSAATIARSGQALLAITDAILELSRIEDGELSLETIDFDLPGLLDEVVDRLGPEARRKGLTLVRRFAPGLPPRYSGDPARIRQILGILAASAIEAARDGEIALGAERAGEGSGPVALRIACRIGGVADDREPLASILRSFDRAVDGIGRPIGGAGIGPILARKLARLMGAEIGVERDAGEGIALWLDVRLPPADPPASDPGRPAVVGPSRPRVLVADDQAINRKVIIGLLEQLGCSAEAAVDGWSAVEAWGREEFALVLMDVDMPGLDGPAAAIAIRRREAELGRPRTPILCLIDPPHEGEQARRPAEGIDGELARPITRPKLQAALEGRSARVPAPERREPPLRISALLERCLGDPLFAREVLDSFREATPVTMEALGDLAGRGDLRRLATEAHGLRGSAATVGALPLSAACEALEASARGGDLAASRSALAEALAAWSDLIPALAAATGEVGL